MMRNGPLVPVGGSSQPPARQGDDAKESLVSAAEPLPVVRTERTGNGIAEIIMNNPPVNALPAAGWFEVAGQVTEAGRDPGVRAVILRAEGRGFNAGVDIKELQRAEGYTALLDVNRGCFEAFKAVYECAVPVIAAVHGFCLGGGIGLAGNSDVIIAAEDATFGLPEVDRGALGAATHLSRLVPQHKMRAMVYTSATVTAAELHHFGSVHSVVPREALRAAALAFAGQIAAKDPVVIRRAKESLNGIDLWDVNRSYRFEQGFTFELSLAGAGDRARNEFVAGAKDPGA
jgi:enoyl-CoA hydratase